MEVFKIRDKIILSGQEKEIYRILRTNVELSGEQNRVIVITSCVPGDGKTMVSYNLAVALARVGKSTILVDADLRKSILLKRLELTKVYKGLSDLLDGEAEYEEITYRTNIENLEIMPSGTVKYNSTELLESERFIELIECLREEYDYVIVDTPPLGCVIDSAVVAKCCDASILIVASDQVSKDDARNIVEQLRSANNNILGVVLNKAVNKKKKNYYEKYSDGQNRI